MNKIIKIALMAILGVGIVFVNGCKKDTDNTLNDNQITVNAKKQKSNYQQPTHTVNIDAIISIDNTDYPIEGSAEVGDYDGRIFKCDVNWSIPDESQSLHMMAIIRPQFEDLMLVVDPIIDNYMVDVNNIYVDNNFNLTIGSHNFNYQTICNFWTGMIDQCNLNEIVDTIGADLLALSRQTGVNIFHLSELGLMDDFDNYFSEDLFYTNDIEDTLLFIQNLEPLANYMVQSFNQITSLYPSFFGLSLEDKALILSKIEYFSKVQEYGGEIPSYGVLEDDRDDDLKKAKIKLAAGLALSGISTFALGITMVGAAAGIAGLAIASYSYCDEIAMIWENYRLKGGTEPKPKSVLCD